MLITRSEVMTDLWDQINRPEFGEKYVYDNGGGSCAYVRDDKPSCLIGQYLVNTLKVPMDFFSEKVHTESGFFNYEEFDGLASHLSRQFGIEFEPGLVADLRAVQEYQDDGVYWGAAYNAVFGDGTDPYDNDAPEW